MADIDMIPREYRDGVRVRRTVRRTALALALVAVAGVLGGGALRWRTAALDREASALQSATVQAQAAATNAAAVQADYARRAQAAALLGALRRQGELTALAQGLDAAMTDQVWLTALRVERDVQALAPAGGAAATAATAAAPGVAGAGEEFSVATAAGPAQTWRLAGSVELSGQAASYDAVTAFLSALGRQRGIGGLRLVGSSMATDGNLIDFRATGALVRHPEGP